MMLLRRRAAILQSGIVDQFNFNDEQSANKWHSLKSDAIAILKTRLRHKCNNGIEPDYQIVIGEED